MEGYKELIKTGTRKVSDFSDFDQWGVNPPGIVGFYALFGQGRGIFRVELKAPIFEYLPIPGVEDQGVADQADVVGDRRPPRPMGK